MQGSDKDKMFGALEDQAGDPNLQIGIISAELSESHEIFGKMDLYFKFTLDDEEYQTEVALDQGKTPQWNQDFWVFYKENDIINLQLWESDGGGSSDDYIGKLDINITQYLKQVEPGETIQFRQNIKDKDDNEVIGQLNISLKEKLDPKEKEDKQRNQSEVIQRNLEIRKPQFVDVKPQELEKKYEEIQQKLDNIDLKIKPKPQSTFTNNLNLHRAIVEGLQTIGKEKPDNPVRELGLFLVNYEQNK